MDCTCQDICKTENWSVTCTQRVIVPCPMWLSFHPEKIFQHVIAILTLEIFTYTFIEKNILRKKISGIFSSTYFHSSMMRSLLEGIGWDWQMRTLMNSRYVKSIIKLDENYTKSPIIIWIFYAICDQVKHPSEIPPEWQTFVANRIWMCLVLFYYVMKNTINLILCILFWQATLICHFW